jgi:hypothetical protein
MSQDQTQKAKCIRDLNDKLRTTLQGGRIMMTSGVDALGAKRIGRLLKLLRAFNAFDEDNDPHGEHDFGTLEDAGERFFWKIDYFDPALKYHSDDPADPAKTTRVLTLMLAEEY